MRLKSIKIPLGYLITGLLWALFSHPLLTMLTDGMGLSPRAQEIIRSLNHFAFFVVASIVLYFVIKNQQRQLKSSEEQYRNLFERNPNAMWIYRTDTLGFVKVNKAAIELYGYSGEEFLKLTPKDIRPESERKKFLQVVNSTKSGLSNQGVWTHQKKSGELVYASIVTYDLIFDGAACRLTMINNVTDMILKEEKIKSQNAALHEIAWLNSHEVRKSLCSVISLTELLKDTQSENERQEYIGLLQQSTSELDEVLLKTNSRVDELREY